MDSANSYQRQSTLPIDWRRSVIMASDTEEAKSKPMNDAAVAIEGIKYVAILGIRIERGAFGQGTKKKRGLPT